MTKEPISEKGRGPSARGGAFRAVGLIVALALLGGFIGYRAHKVSGAKRAWAPGEIVVGPDRVPRNISGLPSSPGGSLTTADISSLWLAAYQAVRSGDCRNVTGGGVAVSDGEQDAARYFVSCGPDAEGRVQEFWFRQDEHGVTKCADRMRCGEEISPSPSNATEKATRSSA